MQTLAHSPLTTADTDEPCTEGCGRPRARAGQPPFEFVSETCVECGERLARDFEAELRDLDRSERIASRIRRLEEDLGPRLARYSLDSFPAGRGEALQAAERWLEGRLAGATVNLYLHGPTGEGKTGLAVGVARRLAETGQAVRFVVGRDWLDDVRRASFERRDSTAEDLAREADVLVLDDLGTERSTPFALERLLSLVDFRYRQERPTVVTSNLAPSELVLELNKLDETAGERIVSRLVEDAERIRFGFGNLRLRQREAA